MSAEISQLESIDSKYFQVLNIGGVSYLNLNPPDKEITPSGAFLLHKHSIDELPFMDWLKAWNLDELLEIEYAGMQCVSRRLKKSEIEEFEATRMKMIRAKKYALNHYENSLVDKF
uniref:Uncharacterized protein n=1 Tax=viral metagenome TaxID=1070528 RepID=A0A6M3LKY7_9ZZZZ